MGVFGLLLGIDDYKCPTVANLSGAGADVEAVLELFCDTLHAPKDNFTVLTNQLATRKAIIDALISLRDDDRIKLGDAIIIYLAGHGGMIPAPPGWEAGGKGANIKVIIPHDYCVTSGEEVRAIPDRTIGALLECIAEEKGNNITVIFDCCHSGSGTRAEADGRCVRFEVVDSYIYREPLLDQDVLASNDRALSPPKYPGLNSHVLLSACKEGEVAKENDARGAFTKALLVVLQGDITGMTYSDILDRMDPLPGQNPQCEGVHQNRYIFSLDDPPLCSIVYTPLCEWDSVRRKNRYTLNAGSAHGLAIGDEFTIYPSLDTIGEWNAGLLIIDTIDNFSATLTLPTGVQGLHTFTSYSVAVKSRRGPYGILKLALPLFQDNSLDLLRYCGDELRNVTITAENPHITVVEANDADKLVVQVTNRRITEHGPAASFRNGANIMPEELPQILMRALDYQWELDQTNKLRPLQHGIEVELYELHYMKSQYFSNQCDYSPINSNNVCQNGEIHLNAANGTLNMYGIKITNKTPHGIYLKAYYFNPELLNSEIVFESPLGRINPPVSLSPGGGTLTIGYGSGGWNPLKLPELHERQTVHVGFLKLFLSTHFLPSPRQAHSTSQYLSRGATRRPQQAPVTPQPQPTWDVIVIPVVQRFNGNTVPTIPLDDS